MPCSVERLIFEETKISILTNMAGLWTASFTISVISIISTVLGCGVMPAGQGIAANEARAKAYVERLVMQTVFDVLERQGRSALLPETSVASISAQVEVKKTYEPMQCEEVLLNGLNDAAAKLEDKNKQNCIIFDNTDTGICTKVKTGVHDECMIVEAIPVNHTPQILSWRAGQKRCGKVYLTEELECWSRVHLDRNSFRKSLLYSETG
ncbi:hypothetical protein KIN20_031520 [Parelaphostrongylus tenuis]|uniref:Uncharacterized protein n=1 Tax=Parelaphostrongylus tenuis TaxID=148309 RepID=A0AAD5R5I4_PARTN|nr:hypothetical protein KIN20_031520 [Parelaphostrongylus tenuis]